MANIEVTVPDLGVDSAVEVIEVCVEQGQQIQLDDPVVVLESDKATMEIPSSGEGVVTAILVKTGDKVTQGDRLIELDSVSGTAIQKETKIGEQAPESDDELDDARAENEETQTAAGQAEEINVTVPDLGGAEQVEIIELNVSEGDDLSEEQTILVLESDKATMEIPSPVAGRLLKLLVNVGDKVSEGDLIAKVEGSREASRTTNDKENRRTETPHVDSPEPQQEVIPEPNSLSVTDKANQTIIASSKAHAGPAVRKLARELGLDLTLVEGSGRKGRVLKDDVKAYVKRQLSQAEHSVSAVSGGLPEIVLPDFSSFGEVEIVEMDKLQKITAANMQRSWSLVPHVTQFDEADITELESYRKSKKSEAEKLGVKLTPLPFILKACAHALHKYPQFNVSLDLRKHAIIRKKYIHIGIAVDTPAGLVVPVIREVDQKNIWQLAEECMELASRARERKLKPSEMQGGCFTISSLGSIGGTAFTPIVNTPEVGILGVSKAEYKPKYNGEAFEARLMLPLSLSYDHRAVNGVDGAKFAAHVANVLSDLRDLLF